MNWNSNAPMELLSRMPHKLSKSNLEAIQKVIDNDKDLCSIMLERDLCGEYAPFCVLCDKSMRTPCAVAYIRMKQAEGIQLEIAVSEENSDENANSELAEKEIIHDEGIITAEPCAEELEDPAEPQNTAECAEPEIETVSEQNTDQTSAEVEKPESEALTVEEPEPEVPVVVEVEESEPEVPTAVEVEESEPEVPVVVEVEEPEPEVPVVVEVEEPEPEVPVVVEVEESEHDMTTVEAESTAVVIEEELQREEAESVAVPETKFVRIAIAKRKK